MKRIFTMVYERQMWGDNGDSRYKGSSGSGSSIENNKEYIPFLKKFIKDNEIETVVDLGCGDFRCGGLIYNDLNVKYTGYDAYKKVVDNNSQNFAKPKFEFIHLDFCKKMKKLKKSDLCIIKDVIQHWSLDHIYTFMDYLVKSKKFKYVLLINCAYQTSDNTEIHTGDFRPLSYQFLPLKKYNPVKLLRYGLKEILLLTL